MWNAGLKFGVLGPLQMIADGGQVPLGAPKQRAGQVRGRIVVDVNR